MGETRAVKKVPIYIAIPQHGGPRLGAPWQLPDMPHPCNWRRRERESERERERERNERKTLAHLVESSLICVCN